MENFKMFLRSLFIGLVLSGITTTPFNAQNPFIKDQFTADPSARVFNGKVYVFPSHDIPAPEGKNLREDWFAMEDYHVFSSENLVDWTDHGMIVSQYDAPWIDSTAYSMWAPDCVERNGQYYFYFPATLSKPEGAQRRGFGIGVAVADQPEGPYTVQPSPIEGVAGIDPNVLIDSDGQAYLYWSHRHIFVAKLKENMLELDSEPMIIPNLPEEGLKEGPWVFERNGLYYLTFPHVENDVERLEYAIGTNPMGPFTMTGVIMDESPTGCWTNHHSIVEYNQQWYLFYHHNDYSPDFDKNRSVRIDSLSFNTDGTIQKVMPTLRGVGLTKASDPIQLDRYSALSQQGASIAFMDPANPFLGWKTRLDKEAAYVQYNAVDFENASLRKIKVKALSKSKATIQIYLNKPNGKLLAEISLPQTDDWQVIENELSLSVDGAQDLVVVLKEGEAIEIDWIQFQ
jgi:GH43 family beta-xylosidase